MAVSPTAGREKIKTMAIVQSTPLNKDGGKGIVLVPVGSTGDAYSLGPIFAGMLLSGKRVAELIVEKR